MLIAGTPNTGPQLDSGGAICTGGSTGGSLPRQGEELTLERFGPLSAGGVLLRLGLVVSVAISALAIPKCVALAGGAGRGR